MKLCTKNKISLVDKLIVTVARRLKFNATGHTSVDRWERSFPTCSICVQHTAPRDGGGWSLVIARGERGPFVILKWGVAPYFSR